MMMDKVIQEISILDVIKYVGKKNKKLQAILLQEIEKYIEKDSEAYTELRKVILDETSNFSRAVIRQIFGEIDGLIK